MKDEYGCSLDYFMLLNAHNEVTNKPTNQQTNKPTNQQTN